MNDARTQWCFSCLGIPVTQGSKRAFLNKKTGRPILTDDNPRTKSWRGQMMEEMPAGPQLVGPVVVRMVFTLPKPKSAKKSEFAPRGKNDCEKLARAVCDAITDQGLWTDDGHVVEFSRLAKVWPGHDPDALHVPGVIVAALQLDGPVDRMRRLELRDLMEQERQRRCLKVFEDPPL